MRIPWYFAALGAALVWGMHYPLMGYVLKKLSLVSALVLAGLPVLVVGLVGHKTLAQDMAVIKSMTWSERLPIMAIPLTSLLATVLLYHAINSKNATLASLLEISYPVFVVFFAYLFFREWHINNSVLIGAVFIFSGVALIITGNR
ncbi:MAG: hypothetical protein BMS9Abin11_0071 [Gammaproteobacteria bacterium]|nr:MAG: hypothetical protein BMS9Abin11_0071 [Gammaproteobacteria bacterium]